ncbi:MAG TPA: sigma 54-interacting transcriptional regulator [Terriglobales bacterium]|jgi:formate hydrogenlyase transcriptional activator|nr:sigma 54-interacting transcriptional regulator [Terriglobales bacterium]
MGTDSQLTWGTDTQRYEALFRIFEALSTCREPEELSRVLADQLIEVIAFHHLDVVVFKDNSKEIEWHVWGKGPIAFPDLPIEETSMWHVYHTQEPLHIADYNGDQRFPRLRQLLAEAGVELGSLVRVPLTTAHRRLGTLGIASEQRNAYTCDDVKFFGLLARGVALAVDDGLNLKKSQSARSELEQQNARLKLLLDLANRITSNLDIRELLRSICANVREVMHCDAVGVTFPDSATGTSLVYALDFPASRGFVAEELLSRTDRASAIALETLKPVIVNQPDAATLGPEAYERGVGEGFKAQCRVPLVNRGRALGVLCLARRNEHLFSEEDADFLSQASGQIAVAVQNALAYREISELKEKIAREKVYLEEEIRSEIHFEQIHGNSPALKRVLELVEKVAPSDSTVLLLGETGTGKELIARALHDHSRRKERTFVKLNCAAIPTGLLESELFGHEKGAFTGAITQKIGRLELADQGTLFLDEVGDIPIEIQPKLLRALQEREFERLGSTHTRKVSVRLVAATNRDLEKMIAAREFRSDLYYRLNVFPIRVPALRERMEDIPLLVRYFVQKFSRQMQKNIEAIPDAAMRGLTNWDWPGNIRELENLIERAVILTRGASLEVPLAELRKLSTDGPDTPAGGTGAEDIGLIVRETISALRHAAAKGDAYKDEHDNGQREEIVRVLRESKGRIGGSDGAAARMSVRRTTLLSRIKRLGINPKQFY